LVVSGLWWLTLPDDHGRYYSGKKKRKRWCTDSLHTFIEIWREVKASWHSEAFALR
jgi:hypothetical protein